MKLNQDVKSKTWQVEQCYVRMERGEAPSDDIEQEWLKLLRNEVRRLKDQENKARVSENFCLCSHLGNLIMKYNLESKYFKIIFLNQGSSPPNYFSVK